MRAWRALAVVAVLAAPAAAQEARVGIPVASISLATGRVERASAGANWAAAKEGEPLRTGESLRTGPDGAARVQFPWMGVALGPDTVLRVPGGHILSTVLENGRVELVTDGDIVKLRAGTLDIRGRGRIVVRHDGSRTAVMSQTDAVKVTSAGGKTVELEAGEALVADGERVRGPLPLPPAPRIISPAGDPLYVQPATAVPLQWAGTAHRFVVELVPLETDTPLLSTETTGTYAEVRVPWLGLYRWRVTGVDRNGLETAPSEEGLICVVEK
jgi:hypothetical protein